MTKQVVITPARVDNVLRGGFDSVIKRAWRPKGWALLGGMTYFETWDGQEYRMYRTRDTAERAGTIVCERKEYVMKLVAEWKRV